MAAMKESFQIRDVKELFLSMNIRYMKQTEFERPLNARSREQSFYYQSYRLDFQMLLEEYGAALKEGIMAPCEIRPVSEHVGYGLFASRDFQAGELLGEYTGIVQRARRSRRMKDSLGGFNTDYSWTYPVKRGLFPLEVNARLQGNELRMVNHSFEPNLRMEHCLMPQGWILFMVVDTPVKEGEQFTIDYGEEYWTGGKRELVLI